MKAKLGFLVVALLSLVAEAQKPINLSLTPDIALHDRQEEIQGFTLSVWGENPQRGVALGIVNGTPGDSAGLSLALILNYADTYSGVQLALANYVKGDLFGLQKGVVNYVGGAVKGAQIGVLNYAGSLTGLQFGFVNYASSANSGLQIGLVNIIPENVFFDEFPAEVAPVMIIANWKF